MILEKLRSLIADQLGVDSSNITMDTNFEEDLGVDSLDIVELSMALEEEFDIGEISEEDLATIKTVGDHDHKLQGNHENSTAAPADAIPRPVAGVRLLKGRIGMKTLEEKIGYTFRDRTLLENALTHSSYANEHRGGLPSNERLEFLGDSILGLVVADHLYRTRPDLPEGDLTRIRAALVCEGSLVQVAKSLDLGSYLKLGKGEAHGGGRARPSIQADAVEAMLAAVYLDGGIGQARKLIHDLVLTDEKEKTAAGRDFKTALQELVQRESGQVLAYRLTGESGPDHAKTFCMEVQLNGKTIGAGQGRSKKEAEQAAAKAAVASLEQDKA